MSQYFNDGDRNSLWNPSSRVAVLFVRTSEVVSSLVGLPSGIGGMWADEYAIDVDVFVRFVDALVLEYRSSSHQVLRSLLEGWLVTAIVMVERAGRELPSLRAEVSLSPRDVSVGSSGVGALGDGARLLELAGVQSRAMPV
ncbi:DUF6086 family protein [Actinoplanes sp. NEAU-A12]|uniref:DUF6086 family protein n=1 Tax=Actinoplanes sandaracinus TaxID=3045177 RepID=A0ABT6WZ91_9ACTN|nr:DUF6086 family protein [Actinoplanes sandaracinus]MDI6105077.1 DUF6086 family protein [Actinoplanes sandaracinus]